MDDCDDDTPQETIPPVAKVAAASSEGRKWLALWIVDGIMPGAGARRRREGAQKWLDEHVTPQEQADMRAAAERELDRIRARLGLPTSSGD